MSKERKITKLIRPEKNQVEIQQLNLKTQQKGLD